jgi:hypothetical protein
MINSQADDNLTLPLHLRSRSPNSTKNLDLLASFQDYIPTISDETHHHRETASVTIVLEEEKEKDTYTQIIYTKPRWHRVSKNSPMTLTKRST